MVDKPKATGERALWDLHTPTTVDNRDTELGDGGTDIPFKANYVKTYDRAANRHGYSADAADRQGQAGLRRTSVPHVTVQAEGRPDITYWKRENDAVNEMHSVMQQMARQHLCRAQVCQRNPGGFLAQLKIDGSPADMEELVAELAEQVEAIGAEVTLLQITEQQTWDTRPTAGKPVIVWVRLMRDVE